MSILDANSIKYESYDSKFLKDRKKAIKLKEHLVPD